MHFFQHSIYFSIPLSLVDSVLPLYFPAIIPYSSVDIYKSPQHAKPPTQTNRIHTKHQNALHRAPTTTPNTSILTLCTHHLLPSSAAIFLQTNARTPKHKHRVETRVRHVQLRPSDSYSRVLCFYLQLQHQHQHPDPNLTISFFSLQAHLRLRATLRHQNLQPATITHILHLPHSTRQTAKRLPEQNKAVSRRREVRESRRELHAFGTC